MPTQIHAYAERFLSILSDMDHPKILINEESEIMTIIDH